MTCVAGIIGKNGDVYMWSDMLASTKDDKWLYQRGKVFEKEDLILWYSGSIRTWQILETKRNVPERTSDQRTREYITSTVVDSIIEVLEANYVIAYDEKDSGNPNTPYLSKNDASELLIWYRWRLFYIQNDLVVLERVEDFNAIGSGSSAAMSTLKTLKWQIYSKPKRAIKESIKNAGTYVPSVSEQCSEILVLTLKDENKEEREKNRAKKWHKNISKSPQKKIKAEETKEKRNEIIEPHIQNSEELVPLSESADVVKSSWRGAISSDQTSQAQEESGSTP